MDVSVEFKGGSTEVLRKKLSQGAFAYPDLEFVLLNVLNNDPALIKSVVVKVDNKTVPTQMVPAQSGLGYKAKLRLSHGKSATALVIVTMKNGQVVTAEKTYELR